MKKVTKTATAKTANGAPLATPFDYEFSYMEFETGAELEAAGETMDLDAQKDKVNADRLAAAKSKVYNQKLKDMGIVKPTAANNDIVRLKEMFKLLQTAKTADGSRLHTDEAARQIASTVTGVAWPDQSADQTPDE